MASAIPDTANLNIAKKIISIGKEMGMNEKQILSALSAAYVESGIRNLDYGDRDSLGVFQQRPSMGWGSRSQVTDPDYAIRKYYTELGKLNWSGSIGSMAQRVQRSAYPDRYDERGLPIARSLLRQLGGEAGLEQSVSDDVTDEDITAGYDDDGIDDLWMSVIDSMSDAVMQAAGGPDLDDVEDYALAGDYFLDEAERQRENPEDPVIQSLGDISARYQDQLRAQQSPARPESVRADAAAVALAKTAQPGGWGGFANGRIPASALYRLETQPGHMLRQDAGEAWDLMYRAAKRDGVKLRLTDSYRDYATQVSLKQRKPSLAATPGKSNHGWGVAVDISTGGFDTTTYLWLARNAYRFGYQHPTWAQRSGSKPEPWHWEFVGTRTARPVDASSNYYVRKYS